VGRLFRHRDATIYLCGQTLSTIGDNSLWLAMAIWVKILTGSNSAAGLVFFFFVAGVTLAPVTGVLVDRVRRRPLAAWANLTAAAMVCLLLLVHGRGQVWLIYAVMFCYGTFTALLMSAQTALVPSLVPADLLGEANALLQMGSQGMKIFTPLIGAGMLAWLGAAPVIVLDAATFVIAAGCMFALSLREPRPARTEASWRAELTAGLRYAWRTPVLRKMLVTTVLALAVIGFMETISFAIVSSGLHRKPSFLGVLVAAQAAGAIAGAVVTASLMKRLGEVVTIAVGLLLLSGSCLLMMTGSLPVVLAGSALLGVAIIWINVAAITLIQRRTAPALMGRVDAALTLASTGPQAVSIAVGAALIAVIPYQALLAAIAVMMVVCCGYWLSGQHRAALPGSEPDARLDGVAQDTADAPA
jgi:Na+/melibiose symporter-like transporter